MIAYMLSFAQVLDGQNGGLVGHEFLRQRAEFSARVGRNAFGFGVKLGTSVMNYAVFQTSDQVYRFIHRHVIGLNRATFTGPLG